MQCRLLGNSCSWDIPFGSQLPCHEKPTYRHSVTSPRWSHSWSQYQLPIMWTSPIKLLDDCNLGLIEAGELLSWVHRIMSNNGIVILSHSALELFVRKQYVIRVCCHSMSWATILHSQTIMGSSFLGSRWVIWLQNSIFKICFLGSLGTNYLKSGPLRNIYWGREDRHMHAQSLLGSNQEQQGVKKGLGRRRGWTVVHLSQRSQPVPQRALEMGWTFRVKESGMSNWMQTSLREGANPEWDILDSASQHPPYYHLKYL